MEVGGGVSAEYELLSPAPGWELMRSRGFQFPNKKVRGKKKPSTCFSSETEPRRRCWSNGAARKTPPVADGASAK